MDFKFNPNIEKELYDVCIVGAGASGLMAANVILREKPDCKLLIVDAKDRPGRKIAASGNGKCNLSNIKSEGWSIASAFFGYLGVLTKSDEEGRIYPYSEYAPDIVEALTSKLESADWLLSCRLTSVKYAKGVFLAAARQDAPSVKSKGKGGKSKQAPKEQKPKKFRIKARRLVLACGGTAAPQLGTRGKAARARSARAGSGALRHNDRAKHEVARSLRGEAESTSQPHPPQRSARAGSRRSSVY